MTAATSNPNAAIPPGLRPLRSAIENVWPVAAISATARPRLTLESHKPVRGRQVMAWRHPVSRNGAVDRIQAASKISRFSVAYANIVDPRIRRIPTIAPEVQSRFGIIKVAAIVRQENSSISVPYNEGACHERSAQEKTETSAARNPISRAWRRYTARTIAKNQGTENAKVLRILAASFIVRPLVRLVSEPQR